jgi:hypothetical protein
MKTCGRILFFLFVIAVVTVDSLAPSRVASYPHGSFPSMHKKGRTHAFRRRYRGSQFAIFPSSSSSSSTSLSLAMSATSGVIASLRSSLHVNHGFVLSALLVVSSCGIAMEQRTTFGKALSVSLPSKSLDLITQNPILIIISSIILI